MSQFFINRPIVAMVIAIITVIVGLVSMARLPVAQYPNIVPPQIQVNATYVGADALTVEQSVATPIEQQVNGVEEDVEGHAAVVGIDRIHVFHALDAVDLLLDRRGHGLLDGQRIRADIGRVHLDLRRDDVRVLRDGQTRHGD